MSSDKPENELNDQLESLFGKPALLESEDKERYLRAAVLRDLKSKSTLDWIDAQDQIDKVWEEQRYKRAGVALNSSAVR
jgi:hypothetical protein